jgi:peptidoglycan/LPS O-acetylase OafA/YrhL
LSESNSVSKSGGVVPRGVHLPALDGLRGLAILMVIAHNVQQLDTYRMGPVVKATFLMFNLGWAGVQLFFVLSGFLITGILLDTLGKPGALKNFMVRRALRIFPLYYGALLVIFVLLPALNLQPDIYKAQAPYQIWLWTYLSNWTDPLGYGPEKLPHFWSLAVEEQFYLFWPLLVLAVRTPKGVAWLSLAVALIGLGSRAWMVKAGVDVNAIYSFTICRVDALALGALVAAWWRIPACASWFEGHLKQICIGVTVMVICAALWTHGFPRTTPRDMVLGFTVLAVAFATMTWTAALRDSRLAEGGDSQAVRPTLWHRVLTIRPLREVGKYSYGIYVVHKPLYDLFSARALKALGIATEGSILNATLHIAAVTLVSFAAAWLSYQLYEVHFLNLKRYFE